MTQETKELDLLELFNKVWKARKRVIKAGIIGGAIGIVIAFSLPKLYMSSVKVAPEQTSDNGSLGAAAGIASMFGVGGGANEDGLGVMLYPEIIKSTPFLMEFANIEVQIKDGDGSKSMPLHEYMLNEQKKPWWSYVFGLPLKAISGVMSLFSEDRPEEVFANSLRKQSKFCKVMTEGLNANLEEKKGVFTISCTFQDPTVAKVVADSALVKLQRYMSKYQTAKTRSNLSSNQKMLQEAKMNFYHVDSLYSAVYDRNQNIIRKSAEIKLSRLEDERDIAAQIYKQIALQVETEKIKLEEEKQIATIIEPVNMPLEPVSPNKMMILFAFGFLGALVPTSKIIFSAISNKNED